MLQIKKQVLFYKKETKMFINIKNIENSKGCVHAANLFDISVCFVSINRKFGYVTYFACVHNSLTWTHQNLSGNGF